MRDEKWKSENHPCERCGKIMKTKYGSGRFCSRACANARVHSEETKSKIAEAAKIAYENGMYPQLNSGSDAKRASSDTARKRSERMQKEYENNPSHCCICGKELPYKRRNKQTCSNECYHKLISKNASAAAKNMGGNLNPYGVRGTAKYGTYKGIHCDSSWELAYVMYCLDHNILIERNGEGFEYTYNNEQHMYYPDFVVDGVYIEVKNFDNDQVQAKISQFPKDRKLKVLFKPDMKRYINYCVRTYGKDYAELYDKDKPSWLDRKSRKEKKTA